jgi:hypothetical protein
VADSGGGAATRSSPGPLGGGARRESVVVHARSGSLAAVDPAGSPMAAAELGMRWRGWVSGGSHGGRLGGRLTEVLGHAFGDGDGDVLLA